MSSVTEKNKEYVRLLHKASLRDPETIDGDWHHIIPRCVGGSDLVSNLIKLTKEEHRAAHLILPHLYPESYGLKYAANLMSGKRLYGPWNKGLRGFYSEAYKRKISESRKGKKLSSEHKRKIRENSSTDKPIIVYEAICIQFRKRNQPSVYKRGKILHYYPGIAKASRDLNIPRQHIHRVLNGDRHQCKSMIFEYNQEIKNHV